jgi:branched-chain amino acid transport system ATP-binding protein
MLQIHDLRVAYAQSEALHGLDLEVHPGELVAIIGANGAGKTTLINTVSGIVRARSGEIRFNHRPLGPLPAWKIARAGLIQVPEGRKVFPKLSVRDNLEMGGFALNDPALLRRRVQEMEAMFPLLAERRHQAAGTLSGGEQQMLAIARGLMTRPQLLLLDEPSMGLAPIMVERVFALIAQIHAQGIAILLVEQNAKKSLQLAQRAYVLETGRMALQGTGAELLANPLVQKAYLGVA